MKNKKLREQVKSYIIVTLACVLYALSFDWFYAPNGFTVGGFTGVLAAPRNRAGFRR